MVMLPVLFDTNILIDYLRDIPQARAACDRHADRAVSIVTWMEVMAGSTADNEADARSFLLNFYTLPLDADVAERAFLLRRTNRINTRTQRLASARCMVWLAVRIFLACCRFWLFPRGLRPSPTSSHLVSGRLRRWRCFRGASDWSRPDVLLVA